MKVLVACEYSGNTRRAFRALGHDAYSCDLLPSDDRSKHHFKCDVRKIIKEDWDLLIDHPPCTYLSRSGLHWNNRRPGRSDLTSEAVAFARMFIEGPETAHIRRRATENPVGCLSSRVRKPEQIVQPWQFGHDVSKATCLWLTGLPPLRPTGLVKPRSVCCGVQVVSELGCHVCLGVNKPLRRWGNQLDSGQVKLWPSADRWKIYSTTYSGISAAMASQWGVNRGRR